MTKAELAQERICAWLIDLLLCFVLARMFGQLGWVAGILYWLLRGGCFDGQSVGKRLMGFKVVVGRSRTRCTAANSVLRNLLWVIPVVNVVMGLTGIYYLSNDRAGQHWGDRLADTRVVKVTDAQL